MIGKEDTEKFDSALSNGSIVINSENGKATISFNIKESEDLKTWQKTGEAITKTLVVPLAAPGHSAMVLMSIKYCTKTWLFAWFFGFKSI